MDSGIVFLSDHAPSENKDQYDYFPDSQNVATYSDFIIPQCDGNDSIDDVDDTAVSITGANNILTKVANFELNRAKQTAGIYRDAQNQDFTLVHKDHDKNINIECSSGFYSQVAKPTLCSLAQDYIPPVLGHTITCDNITKNIDASGSEYNLTLFFKVTPDKGRGLKVTVHTHNCTRLVQVQGGATMPDKTTAALWFGKNVLHGKFHVLAKSRRFSISGFNNAIISGVASSSLDPTKMKCGGCDIQFDSRAKPSYCSRCTKWFHKTNCHKGHRCFLLTSVPTAPSSSQAAPQSSGSQTSLHPSINSISTTTTRVSTPTTLITSSTNSLPAVTPSPQSLVPLPPPLVQLNSPPVTNNSCSLNPSAQQFVPAAQPAPSTPLPARQRRTRQTQNNLHTSPRKAEVESLKIELGYAHAKIAEIQSRNRDNQETIKIYSQKLELIEKGQSAYFHDKYFSSSSDMSSSMDCPCQTKSKIFRNTENLRNLEVKIMNELEKINAKLGSQRTTAQPTPSSQPPRPPSLTHSVQEDILPTQTNQHENFVQSETISQFIFDDTENPDDPVNVDEDAHASSPSSHQSNSDFEFSDNFEPPELSPKLHLNGLLMTTQT